MDPESPNVPTMALRVGPKFGSEDITAIPPLFMYLWCAIKSDCLDREITPCLPTNKPSPLGSSPLFIIHNLLWCQGQSDSIVTVKGKSAQPELSIKIENPDKQKSLKCPTALNLVNKLKTPVELKKVTKKKTRAHGEDTSVEKLHKQHFRIRYLVFFGFFYNNKSRGSNS